MQEFLVFIIGLVILIITWIIEAQQKAKRYTPIAEKFDGVYTPGGNFRGECLTLPYRSYDLVIELRSSKSHSAAFIASLEMEKPHLPEISLATNSILKKSLDIEEENRILTGDDRFDFLFQVVCEDADLARKIFSKDVRDNLKSKLLYTPKFYMEPDYFELTTSYPPVSFSQQKYEHSVNHFIKTALSILDAAWE